MFVEPGAPRSQAVARTSLHRQVQAGLSLGWGSWVDGERGCGWEPSWCGAGPGTSARPCVAGLSEYLLMLFFETVVFLMMNL